MPPFTGGGSPGAHGRYACLRRATTGEETEAHDKEEGAGPGRGGGCIRTGVTDRNVITATK
jgi:hypothetical protein